MYRTRLLNARQDGYDQIPAFVQQREDLAYGAKLLYGLLQSVHRLKWEPDYRWLARELHASVRSIIRWVKQLVDARLIAVRRRGQGLTNLFVVLALVTSGTATLPSAGVPTSHRRPDDLSKKKENRNNRGTQRDYSASDYFETREGRLKPRT
jgi:hypothetical protein